MKLLAIFGVALTVVAIDKKSIFDHQKALMLRPQVFLEFFEFDPNNPAFCFWVLSMIYEDKISLTANPEVIPPLVRCYLETSRSLSLGKKTPPEMDIVHAAIFIFMFRVKGDEKTAENLYNSVMKKHFPEQFKWMFHAPYTLDFLQDFKSRMTGHKMLLLSSFMTDYERQLLSSLMTDHETQLLSSLETVHKLQLLSSLKTERERQLFFMLWTVQMYDKRPESQDARQKRLLEDSYQVALILISVGFPPDPLIAGIFQLQKKLLVGTTPDSLHDYQLVFISPTRDDYLRLGELEKAQLRAFLEKYVKFRWRDHSLLTERLSNEELEQFQKIFEIECRVRCEFFESYMSTKFVVYFYNLIQDGYPIFLLKKSLTFT